MKESYNKYRSKQRKQDDQKEEKESITMSQLKIIMNELGNNKAVGYDPILKQMIKKIRTQAQETILSIINQL